MNKEHIHKLHTAGFEIEGIVFDEDYYADGVVIYLYDEGQPKSQFERAKSKLRCDRDILGIHILRLEEE